RLLRTVPAVAADERYPPRRQAHLDLLDGIFIVDDDAEAVGEDAFRVVAVLVRVGKRAAHGLGRLDPREAIGVRRAAARPPDDVELMIVDGERQRLDAHRFARADEGGDHRGDGDALCPAGDLRAIDADVDLSFPSFPDERDVPSDRFQLAVDRRDAHSEQGRRFGSGQIASGEQHGDELRGPLDGTEASEVRARHDPWRIVRSAQDLNCPEGPRSAGGRGPAASKQTGPKREGGISVQIRLWVRPTILVLIWVLATAYTLSELATVGALMQPGSPGGAPPSAS